MLTFPDQLDRIRDAMRRQENVLQEVAQRYADALESGGLVHLYANGHSLMTVAETVVRMGALTGFRPVVAEGLTRFVDVVGSNGIRVCQHFEKYESIGAKLLDEIDFGAQDVMTFVSATGQTQAAVDTALAFAKRYPDLPLVVIASREQAEAATPKHSSGKTLFHVADEAAHGYFLDNGMPLGDLSTEVQGETGTYRIAPLSSIGAFTVTHCLNELTLRELDRRGVAHTVLQNMHLGQTGVNYDQWVRDQRQRYARATHNPDAVPPAADSGAADA